MNQLGFYDINGKTQFHQPSTTPNSRLKVPLKSKYNNTVFKTIHGKNKEKTSVTKGKPWTADQEATLKALVEANTPLDIIAFKLNKKPDTIYVKCTRMGLTQKPQTTPSNIPLPKELPSGRKL